MIANKLNFKLKNKLTNVLVYFVLIVLSIVWIYPILWIVLQAFRVEFNDNNELIGIVVSYYFPKSIGLVNFKNLFLNTYFLRWLLNTLIVSISSCILSTFLTLSIAYVISKIKFKFRKAYMNVALILGVHHNDLIHGCIAK